MSAGGNDSREGPLLVILESPYAGDVEANVAYARRCLRDSLARGEAPIASHLLYTQPGVLDDTDPAQRACGIDAGLAWLAVARRSVAYVDRGISPGMRQGIYRALRAGIPVESRRLDEVEAGGRQALQRSEAPGARTVPGRGDL